MTSRLTELRALLKAGTPGPWIAHEQVNLGANLYAARQHISFYIGAVVGHENAALIAAAVNALPALIAVAEAAHALHKSMHAPDSDSMHSDVYSLQNCDVLRLGETLTALDAATGKGTP